VDLNGDGYRDIISGSWPGELFLFEGTKDGSFAAPVMIRDRDGKIINIGGGISDWQEGGILIKGSAEFETTDEGTFVTYHGKRMESSFERPIAISGTASVVTAADWDADGDYDLIVSDISGNVHLLPNEGSAKSYAFGKEKPLRIGDDPIQIPARRAGVAAADWDGDGDIDLLVGAGDGSVSLFENTGSPTSPKLAAPVELVGPGKVGRENASKEPQRGGSSKVCAADWNGDGKLDLLVGDYATLKTDLSSLTDEDKARHEKIRKELEPINTRYSELSQKVHGPDRIKSQEQHKAIREEYNEVSRRMRELRDQLPREYENHGWVWLFLRK
jgi:hypothetical protein